MECEAILPSGTVRPADGLAVPSPWIRRYAHLIPADAVVLDLAAGGGRHARFFRQRRNRVVAVDRSLDGMADLAGTEVELIEADLEAGLWPLGERLFGAIVVTNYLFRRILPLLAARLAPGGVLLYETFAAGQEKFGRPSNPDFLLQPNELLTVFQPLLTIVAYENGIDHAPGPVARQRLAAINSPALAPL